MLSLRHMLQSQLWISRLYQFITAHNITLLLVPTKLNTSADFLTRKVHNVVACKGTNKRVPCELCPGCKSHCIRSASHTGCPYAIGASGNDPPRLISFDTITHHSVELDCSTIPFQKWAECLHFHFYSFSVWSKRPVSRQWPLTCAPAKDRVRSS